MPRLADNGIEELHAVSPVEHRVVDRAGFAAVRLEIAEAALCFAFGVGARESLALHEILDATLEMEAELIIDGVVHATAVVGETEDASPTHCTGPTRAFTTRPTTSVYADQREISSERCFRPFAVRR